MIVNHMVRTKEGNFQPALTKCNEFPTRKTFLCRRCNQLCVNKHATLQFAINYCSPQYNKMKLLFVKLSKTSAACLICITNNSKGMSVNSFV